jgi:putative heme iron utilization protein
MSRHAGPPPPADATPPPEPTFAERARTLVQQASAGTLATASRKHGGHPFASLMPYAHDEQGCPLFLISSMAVHTQNLAADGRASLLVLQPGTTGDPLAAGRVTLMGTARRLPDDASGAARTGYLARHPSAAYWVNFGDFAFWRLDVDDIYFVGGFGAMGWVAAADYRQAEPDPLADAAAGILEHMNRDHADALVAYARHFAGAQADEATMAAVDRLGFKLRLRQGQRRWSVRIPFPREVRGADESRTVLIEMLRRARA